MASRPCGTASAPWRSPCARVTWRPSGARGTPASTSVTSSIATGRPPSPGPATTSPSPAGTVWPLAKRQPCSPWRSTRRRSRTPRRRSRPPSASGPGTTRTLRGCCGAASSCWRDGPTRPRRFSCAWVRRSGSRGRPRQPSGSMPLRRSCACTGATWRKPGGSCSGPAPVRPPAAALGWLAWEEGRWEEAAERLAHSVDPWVGGWQLVVGGPMCLPLHVDALLRLGRAADATAIVEAAESSQRQPPRFFAAALAVARFRLEPTPERAAHAQSLAGAASPLSPREVEVAGLVAEGLSNPAIARRLYLSRPTIAHHVAHILTKLGFASRAQIAAWVVQQGGMVQLNHSPNRRAE